MAWWWVRIPQAYRMEAHEIFLHRMEKADRPDIRPRARAAHARAHLYIPLH